MGELGGCLDSDPNNPTVDAARACAGSRLTRSADTGRGVCGFAIPAGRWGS